MGSLQELGYGNLRLYAGGTVEWVRRGSRLLRGEDLEGSPPD